MPAAQVRPGCGRVPCAQLRPQVVAAGSGTARVCCTAAGRRSPAAAPRRPSGRSWAAATPSWAPRATSWAWWPRRWTTPSPGSTCPRPSSPGRGQRPGRAPPPPPRLRLGLRPALTRSKDSSSCPHGRSTPARRRRRLRYGKGAPRHRLVHGCTWVCELYVNSWGHITPCRQRRCRAGPRCVCRS